VLTRKRELSSTLLRLSVMHESYARVPLRALITRVKGEYNEMPGFLAVPSVAKPAKIDMATPRQRSA
jgi:hypothetical protein